MTSVSANLQGHVSPRVQNVLDTRPLMIAGIITGSLLLCCCLCCCCWCRYRSRIQAAQKRRSVARKQNRDDRARLNPDAPSQSKRGKNGTRAALEDEPPQRRRDIQLILQPPKPATRSFVVEEDVD